LKYLGCDRNAHGNDVQEKACK